jgi:glycosyltransferase involved in cell wall biosynthesis
MAEPGIDTRPRPGWPGMGRPTVSIGLPVYNAERYLKECLDSLLAQSFCDFEVVVCDNASDDNTAAIADDYARRDPRVRVYRADRNHGLAWNWNRAFALASGRYFKWAAADDVHLPHYLERTLEVLLVEPDAVLVHSRTVEVDEHGVEGPEVIKDLRTGGCDVAARFHELTRKGWPCVDVFGLVRAEVLAQTGLHGRYPRSDRALLAELGLHGRLVQVPEVLFHRREFAGRASRSHDLVSRYAVFTGRPAPRRAWPTWRLIGGFAAALLRATTQHRGLTRRDALRCAGSLGRSVWGYRRALGRELLRR